MHIEKNAVGGGKNAVLGQETRQFPTHIFIDELYIQLTASAYIN